MVGKIAENWAFVLFAYLIVFFTWAAVSSHDYISSTWRTLKETRQSGLWHLGLLFFPMSYMLAYIYFQAKAHEYTEMSTGIVGLLFAWVDFFRTVVGLWQLHILRRWIVSSIQSMEYLGYTPTGIEDDKMLREMATTDEWLSYACAVADDVRVNESIVENRLMEGDVKCHLKSRFVEEKVEGGGRIMLPPMILRILHLCCALFHLPKLLWCISVSGSNLYTSSMSAVYLQPHEPEAVWLRWACVLISQVFPECLEDMKKSAFSMDGDDNADISTRRAKFAMEVLLSAALHTQLPPPSDSVLEQQEDGTNSGGAECNGRNHNSHSFLNFDEWHRYTKLCQGTFCKQEFLRVACSTGDGLPFGIPHTESESKKSEGSLYSYTNLATKLERYRESFPVEHFEKLEGIDSSALEWLAIFLSVGNWRAEETSSRSIESGESEYSVSEVLGTDSDSSEGSEGTRIETDSGRIVSTVAGSDEDSYDDSAATSFALQNLSFQLGIGTSLNDNTGMGYLGIGSFPLFQSSWKRSLWRNRNILEASLHIDNMMSLCVGSQYSFMLEEESQTRQRLFQAAQAVDPSVDEAEYAPPPFISQPATWDANVLVENERLIYQFASASPEFAFLEQGTTFLGCSMECLRSSLATWVKRNPNTQAEAWGTALLQPTSSWTQILSTEFKFVTSKCFTSCVPNLLEKELFEKRNVKMRLIWELQNYFQGLLPEEGVSPDRPEAIILCILSFPALQVEVDPRTVKEMTESVFSVEDGCAISLEPESSSTCMTEDIYLVIRVPCAPQHVSVQIMLRRTARDGRVTMSAAAAIDSSTRENSFAWELWRNAYSARLESAHLWQKKHGLPCLELVRTRDGIGRGIGQAYTERTGTGESMDIWLGWLPNRASMCTFELESIGFILRRQKEEYAIPLEMVSDAVQHTGILKENQVRVPYKYASLSELEHASVIAREILEKIAQCRSETGSVVKITGEEILQKADEMAEKIGKDNRKESGELQAKLYEAVGVHMNKMSVLRKAIDFLFRGGSGVAKTRRAVEMIECFCAFTGVTKKDAQFGSASLQFEDEQIAEDILHLIESMLPSVGHASIVVRSLARICTSFENFGTPEHKEKLLAALGASILRCSSSEETRDISILKVLFGSILSSCSSDANTLPFLLASEFDETRGEEERLIQLARKLIYGSSITPSVPLAITVLNVALQEPLIFSEKGYALHMLALLLETGAAGVEVNVVRAMELYEKAMHYEQKYDSMNNLANLLMNGAAGVEVDAVRAMELYEEAILVGHHINAMYNLANLLSKGAVDVEVNAVRAVELYEKAIGDNNHINSMNNLANVLSKGAVGVEVNAVRAMKLYERAIREGNHINAMYNLGKLVKNGAVGVEMNAVRAMELYKSAIRYGNHIGAMYDLAKLLMDGAMDVEVNAPRAVELFHRCRNSFLHSRSCNRLGLLFDNGRPCVSPDAAQAALAYTSAILTSDYWCSKFNLAVLLTYNAIGVPKDKPRAAQLYEELLETAAAKDIAGSVANNLGVLLQMGADGIPVDCARAAQLYRRASDNGDHAAGLYNLAVLLKRGFDGVPGDPHAASNIFMRAVRAGGPVCPGNFGEYRSSNNDLQIEGGLSADALRYSIAVERSDDVRAMNNLAVLLQNGAQGVDADPPRALRLYARAVWEGAHVGAMENMARLLETGADGVPADLNCAEEMRARAREFSK